MNEAADDIAYWTPIAFCPVCSLDSGTCRCEFCPDCHEYWSYCECERSLCEYQGEADVCPHDDVPGHGPCTPYRPRVRLQS
jgi:hypothetical protein